MISRVLLSYCRNSWAALWFKRSQPRSRSSAGWEMRELMCICPPPWYGWPTRRWRNTLLAVIDGNINGLVTSLSEMSLCGNGYGWTLIMRSQWCAWLWRNYDMLETYILYIHNHHDHISQVLLWFCRDQLNGGQPNVWPGTRNHLLRLVQNDRRTMDERKVYF